MAAYQFGVGKYEDSEGHKVEILGERNGNLIGVVHDSNHVDGLRVARWNKDGTYRCGPKAERLLPPKQTRTVWINIYPAGTSDACALHLSEELARLGRGDKTPTHALACLKVDLTFTPGEGLDK